MPPLRPLGVLRSAARVALAALVALASVSVRADEPRRLRIVHTNDLGSRFLGFAPNRDYTPLTLGDDDTVGGIARLATVVRAEREAAPGAALVVDGGDLMMGTLFHTLALSTGAELRLLGAIGYDAAVLGNHEFDFRSSGLARTVEAARSGGPVPALLLANVRFDPDDPGDDGLERLYEEGTLRPRMVVERGGLRVGLLGVIGRHAAMVSPYAHPATFTDPIEAARREAERLRDEDGVDVVVCLSHGGVRRRREGGWGGEDVALLEEVPGIDVVVGGHSHTPLAEPVRVGGRPVVQAGAEGQFVGVLDLEIADDRVEVTGYRLVPIDDSVAAADDVHREVETFQALVDEQVLASHDLGFAEPLVATGFDLELDMSAPGAVAASNLGALVADAIRWGIDRRAPAPDGPTDFALTTAGLIRDAVRRGRSGVQQTSDLFRVLGMGIGSVDDSPGYPLVRVYLNGRDLEDLLEALTVAYRLKGYNFYPFFSGLRFRYNPRRVPFDRVYSIELQDADGRWAEIDPGSDELYSAGMNAYILSFLGIVGEISRGLLEVVPKDAAGQPLASLDEALVDADPRTPGVQEVKEWRAFVDYARSFPDADGDGLPEVPERYRRGEARMIAVASLDPRLFYRNAGVVTWAATLAPLFVLAAFFLGVRRLKRHRAKMRSSPS